MCEVEGLSVLSIPIRRSGGRAGLARERKKRKEADKGGKRKEEATEEGAQQQLLLATTKQNKMPRFLRKSFNDSSLQNTHEVQHRRESTQKGRNRGGRGAKGRTEEEDRRCRFFIFFPRTPRKKSLQAHGEGEETRRELFSLLSLSGSLEYLAPRATGKGASSSEALQCRESDRGPRKRREAAARRA